MPQELAKATLHDVARKAGVSHMTVSRVIRGIHNVSAKTTGRVRAAIEETGYRPDPFLSALAAYRSRVKRHAVSGYTIAFLESEKTAFSQAICRAAEEEADTLGYRVESFSLPSDPKERRRLCRVLYHRGIKGLLLGPSDFPLELEDWTWEYFATVSLGTLPHHPMHHAVAMDYFYGALSGCCRLQGEGSKKIAMVVRPDLEARSGHRWLGGLMASGVDATFHPFDEKKISKTKAWLRKEKIDGVLTIHADVAQAAMSLGVKVACLNDSFTLPHIARFFLKPQTIGTEGVRLLHHLLLRGEFGLPALPKLLALQGEWKEE